MSNSAPRHALGALSSAFMIAGATVAVALPGHVPASDPPGVDSGGDRASTRLVAQSGSLIVNGDFSQGSFGWTAPGRTRFTVAKGGRGGGRAARLRRAGRGAASLTDSPDVHADSLQGDEYSGAAYVRSSRGRVRGRLVIREIGADGRLVKRTCRTFRTGRKWSQVSYRTVAQADGSRFDVRITGFRVSRKRALLVDDVTMTRAQVSRSKNQRPVAAFSFISGGLTAAVDAGESRDVDGSIASYSWDFGDGTSAAGSSVDHAYARAGTYQVKLTVRDNRGASSSTSRSMTVTEPTATVKARDSFGRQSSAAWGTADKGGAWILHGPSSAFSVASGHGRLTTGPGQSPKRSWNRRRRLTRSSAPSSRWTRSWMPPTSR